jgi:hypothetical protein
MSAAPVPSAPSSPHLDRWGVAASSLCAVHCAAPALVAAFAPTLGLGFLESGPLEWALLALALGLGVLSLVPSYRRRHRDARPLMLFGLGLSVVLAARLLSPEGSRMEVAGAVLGAVLLVASHALNLRLIRRCAAPCGEHCG